MSILLIEGWEQFGNGTDVQGAYVFTTNVINNLDIVPGRDFGNALRMDQIDQLFFSIDPTNTETIIFCADIRFQDATPSNARNIVQFQTHDNSNMINVVLTTGGELSVNRQGTVLGTTSGLGISDLQWFNLQLKIFVHDTTGTVEMKVEGVTVLDLSGQDTDAGFGNFCLVALNSSSTQEVYYDNIVIMDGAGSENNDFPNNRILVETLFPTGDGTTNDFTPLSGLTNYEMVDEADADDDTSYVSSSTVDAIDLYTMGELSEPVVQIRAVQVFTRASLEDLKSRQLRHLVRSGVTNYEGAPVYHSNDDYRNKWTIWETDPDTAAPWTGAGLVAAEFGFTIEA